MSSGFLLIDKPSGITSHDVIAKVRKALGTKKVGHAGTLDPMATGVLVVGFNQGTKLLTFAVGLDKTYLATIRLGASTVTDDAEGEFIFRAEAQKLVGISDEQLVREIGKLTGEIEQIPSSVSAIKVSGARAYDLVRSGEQVSLAARKVTVSSFDLLSISRGEEFIDLEVSVNCSSGTYIRALARDLGYSLEVGGYLTKLRRTRVGKFDLSQAFSIDQLQSGDYKTIPLLDSARLLMPMFELTAASAADLKQGKQISGQVDADSGGFVDGNLIAVVRQAREGWLRSVVVFLGDSN